MKRMENKVAVVTGGSRGIGKAICMTFAAEGAKVAVTDVREEDGIRVCDEIEKAGGTAAFWKLDVADEKNVRSVMSEVAGKWNGLHVLVNNAGIIGPDKPTHLIEEEEWDKVFAVNVKGVFLCTKHAIPYIKESGGGSIINLSSIYGLVGSADVPAYHATKGAVRLMSKTDALLYAGDNIRVNSIHPGYIWTPMLEEVADRRGVDPEKFREEAAAAQPLGRIGEPDDIARAAVYLASDESRIVTGSELVVDSGYTAG